MEFAKIDPETGLLASALTKDVIFEVFKAGTAPTETTVAGMPEEEEVEQAGLHADTAPATEEGEPKPEPVYKDNPELMQLVQ